MIDTSECYLQSVHFWNMCTDNAQCRTRRAERAVACWPTRIYTRRPRNCKYNRDGLETQGDTWEDWPLDRAHNDACASTRTHVEDRGPHVQQDVLQ